MGEAKALNFFNAVWVETLKVRSSRVSLIATLGFSILPLIGGFFMFILKNPGLSRRMGLISAKAQLTMGTADWPTYLSFLTQAVAVGGIILFGFIISWVFGREYSDHTIKDLLALPTSRSIIVLAKFVVVSVWSAGLVGLICLLGFLVGQVVGLPPVPDEFFLHGTRILAITTCLTIALSPPIAFFASAGRGYLAPMGTAFLALVLAQVAAIIGWGEYFPWAIPAMYADGAAKGAAGLAPLSYWIVFLAGGAGAAGTILWWELADQAQ
jgi:ABC-2 type transport system permease protein